MICKYCGAQTENENKICTACAFELENQNSGNDIFSSSAAAEKLESTPDNAENITAENPFEAQNEAYVADFAPDPRRRKRTSRKAKTALTVAAILIAVGALLLGWFNSPSSKVEKALRNGENDKAYSLFIKHFDKNGSVTLNSRLTEIATETVDEFLNGTIEYENAVNRLEAIKKMGVSEVAEPLEKAEKALESARLSKLHYKKGEEFFAKKNYVAAITEFSAVDKKDCNYSSAQSKLTSAVSNYRNTVLSDAATYVSDGDYDAAIKLLEAAVEVLENDELLEKRITEYGKASAAKSRTEIIATADKYADREDYSSAIRVVLAATAKNSDLADDDNVAANLKYYRDCYEKQTVKELKKLADSKDYSEAGELIAEAEALLEKSDEIEKFKTELAGKLPAMLYTLTPTEATDWEVGVGSGVDTFGFDRSTDGDYTPLSSTSTATFKIEGDYNTFSCKLIAAKSMSETASARVRVTATVGGDYRYRECVVKAGKDAQTLSINITDCETISFSVSGEGADLLLYDGKFDF